MQSACWTGTVGVEQSSHCILTTDVLSTTIARQYLVEELAGGASTQLSQTSFTIVKSAHDTELDLCHFTKPFCEYPPVQMAYGKVLIV
jgi:hypothetical protein